MTLAQAQLFVAVVVALIATWGGLLMAVALLFPIHTRRAEAALTTHSKATFFKGLGVLAVLIGGFALFGAGGLLQLIGFVMTLFAFSMMVLGGAGIAHLMGRRISEMTEARPSFFSLVSGSIVYSLAIGFPYIGWLLFAPVSLIFAMGAGWSAFRAPSVAVAPPATPSYDLQ